MLRSVFAVLAVFVCLGLTPTARAEPTGTLAGSIYDQNGQPLGGVTVTATPAAAPRTPASVVSGKDGAFSFAALRPDRYEVAASAPKLKRVVQKNVRVASGKTVAVNFVMAVRTRHDEVRVVQAAPKPGTERSFNESFDLGMVESASGGSLAQGPARPRAPVASIAGAGFMAAPVQMAPAEPASTEAYDHFVDGGFHSPKDQPLSTFAIDVDTASYANVRRFVAQGQLPPAGAVRIEELINYFPYAYVTPLGNETFAASFDEGACPWNPDARLVRVGLRGRDISIAQSPPANLVFLIDVSGSMDAENKLPLVQRSLSLVVDKLRPQDQIALVVYAGASGVVLPSTAASRRQEILTAIERLSAGGSTNGAGGIALAYQVARKAFRQGGNNRVILATDGDFNVGVTSQDQLVTLIEKEAKAGVFLTVLGFGTGNVKDSTMEKLADHGNGNYAYIDSLAEARKVLVEQASGTLLTIGKDVKIQVELNPARVGAYRLIGYENRMMAAQDFNDDAKDGGEIGAGHTVTALYEIVPPGLAATRALAGAKVDPLRYTAATAAAPVSSPELLTVKVRFKEPDGKTSRKLEFPLRDRGPGAAALSTDLRFAAAVATFGMVLRNSPHRGKADLALVRALLAPGVGSDPGGHRAGFVQLVTQANKLYVAQHGDADGRSLAVDKKGTATAR